VSIIAMHSLFEQNNLSYFFLKNEFRGSAKKAERKQSGKMLKRFSLLRRQRKLL
jgi:hypothetical protein